MRDGSQAVAWLIYRLTGSEDLAQVSDWVACPLSAVISLFLAWLTGPDGAELSTNRWRGPEP